MSLIFVESFDLAGGIGANAATALNAKGWLVGGGPQVVNGRTGHALQLDTLHDIARPLRTAAHQTITLGAAVYQGQQGPNATMFNFFSGGNTNLLLWTQIQADAQIMVANNQFSALGGFIPLTTWTYIEVSVTVGTLGSVQVHVNGQAIINVTNVDTTNASGASTIDTIRLGNGWNFEQNLNFDDLYCTNGSGSVHTGFLGDVRIPVILPRGDGDLSELTNSNGTHANNWSFVDSAAYQTTTYNASSTPGDEDAYAMQPVPYPAGTVLGVQTVALGDKDNTADRFLTPVIRRGGTDYTGSPVALSTGGTTYVQEMYENDPATGLPWTVTDVNATQLGVRVT